MTILQNREIQISFSGILRLVGYGLLVMAVVNVSFLLIHPQLKDPLWEFQTLGAIIERIPFTLLGIVLVYYDEKSDRASIETSILKGLSWFSLISAIVLLLVIPLNINNSFRIYYQQNTTNSSQPIAQKNTLEHFRQQLETVDTKDGIKAILQQQAQINIPPSVDIENLKTNILIDLQSDRDNITSQIRTFRAQKRSLLLKKCLKWNFGALIAAILFFLIWKSTSWARI
jgi:hypothetical protein